jgi:hypothetical protein
MTDREVLPGAPMEALLEAVHSNRKGTELAALL